MSQSCSDKPPQSPVANSLVETLQKAGFKRVVYADQVGSPVFYLRVFTSDQCPEVIADIEDFLGYLKGDLREETITVEISEDGELLQYVCHDNDYCERLSPREDAGRVKELLGHLGITT